MSLTEPKHHKIQYGFQVAILNVQLLKINRHLPIATNNMHMNLKTEIPQTWVTLRKPCRLRLQRDGQTCRLTDGKGESSIHPPPPKNHCGITRRRRVNLDKQITEGIQLRYLTPSKGFLYMSLTCELKACSVIYINQSNICRTYRGKTSAAHTSVPWRATRTL